MNRYNPETYWSEVAERIDTRAEGVFMAGDDEPYYRYKRQCFLNLLNAIDFKDKTVLEVGCGPGGNLIEVYKHQPRALKGVDISEKMVQIAKLNLPTSIEVLKSAEKIPFDNNSFDIVFTVTVLQHNTDIAMFNNLLNEIARVSAQKIVLFERVEATEKGSELCLGRPIENFSSILERNNFKLIKSENLNIQMSYYMAGITRKLFNKSNRPEGEPLSKISVKLQNMLLPISSTLDKMVKLKSDLTMLVFEKT